MENNFIKGKTVLVTGATDGIGYETALQLAKLGAKVLVHGRSKEKGIKAIDSIVRETCNENISLYLADFASFEEIKKMADDVQREQHSLDVLVNNAGNFYKERQFSVDGIEMTYAVNHLAPFMLTMLTLDLIKHSAPARIVNVASSAHKVIKEIDFENLQGERGYDPFTAYALSKLGNMLFTYSLARKLSGTGVTVNALHPGVVATNLLKKSYDLQGVSRSEGARTSVLLASSFDVDGVTGKYFQNEKEKTPSALCLDKQLQEKFWQLSQDAVSSFLK